MKSSIGVRIGRWLCIADAPPLRGKRRGIWRCELCGFQREMRTTLVHDTCSSCVSIRSAARLSAHVSKNSRNPTYSSFQVMRLRCTSPKHKYFHNYGGRGIAICARWSDPTSGFANFLSDMGPRPEGLELDRIDSNGNYEPANCRWVTRAFNNQNRRTPTYAKAIVFAGERVTLAELARRFKINDDTLRTRLAAGLALGIALTKPVQQRMRA